MRRSWMAVVLLLAGCAWREQVLRQAATDLDCGEGQISLSKDGDVVRASGCDRRAIYAERGDGWVLTDFAEPPEARIQRVKQAAVTDLKCALEKIQVEALGDLYRAVGCGRILVYDGRPRELAKLGPKAIPTCRAASEGEGLDRIEWEKDAAPAARVGPEIRPNLPPAFVAKHCATEVAEFRCTVEVTGRVNKCCAVNPVPFAEWAVVESLMQTEYQPAMEIGKPVAKQYVFKTTLRPSSSCADLR